MDFDKPHYRATSSATGNTSEILICLAFRLSSSSSMKFSKSIPCPGRAARDVPISLSNSLSRKLRTNGSLKGGASPFFTTPEKRRGGAFENPEPSSPKVTCIGQVRVKTKKKVKQTRSLSRRWSGDITFRKLEHGQARQNEDRFCSQTLRVSVNHQQQQQHCLPPHRNQRCVHLPVTICEALRSFGSEFSCLFPCKSSCFSTSEREKEEKRNGNNGGDNGQSSSCGAVFARWLVSVNDGKGRKRREIDLVGGGGDEDEMRTDLKERMPMRSSRTHVLENIEIKDDKIEVKGQSVEGEAAAGRMSICIPPKNALLLMRRRSVPMKMVDLANRFSWDANAASKHEDGDDKEIELENENIEEEFEVPEREVANEIPERNVGVSVQQEIPTEAEEEAEVPENVEEEVEEAQKMEELLHKTEQEELEQELEVDDDKLIEEKVESKMSSFEALLDQENVEHFDSDGGTIQQEEVEQNPRCNSSLSAESDEEQDEDCGSTQELAQYEEEVALKKLEETQEETTTQIISHQEKPHDEEEEEEEGNVAESNESESKGQENQEPNKEKESQALPECLLLMMCEPKLSMEVSKETWVCSTDFLRWLPERPLKASNQKPTKGGGREHESIIKKLIPDSKPKPISLPPQNNSYNNQKHLQQPPRSSCSLPAAAAAASMATIIEQKLVNAVGYEPFVLTRCKSEPMRTAAAKLLLESCYWKNAMRKLETHRPATFGVGVAGVGF
ncbi:Hypothetical predicted protein [Olea europaea subsp. europaea]|uniref:Uncharacterized protein n=1 Tax=Olea europaea subsp. europaea TaxID=158383 RepID=A0A8S0USP8_OLEEU|nr:Hypothetical predicted protein [Olea europaea subsp. europaea]